MGRQSKSKERWTETKSKRQSQSLERWIKQNDEKKSKVKIDNQYRMWLNKTEWKTERKANIDSQDHIKERQNRKKNRNWRENIDNHR